MVRLDKCVEALYDDSVTNDNRNKNLQILSVMKGAISMSRSKTGECIFRTNKTEKKNLERVLRSEGRNSYYNIAQIDSKRKQVLVRWSKVLEQQTVCSSETLFEELMEINPFDNDESLKVPKSESPDPGDGKLRHLVNLRLSAIEKETNAGTYVPVVPRRRRLSFKSDDTKSTEDNEFVTVDKQIRGKYSNGKVDDTVKAEVTNTEVPIENVLGKTKLVHLPVIRQENMTTPKNPETSPRPMPPERDLTDWGNWGLKDKSWIKGYLFREKTRHTDLIIRNALNKIESDMSGANMIQRQQMRHKLQQEKQQREVEARHHMRAQKALEAPGESDMMTSDALRQISVCDRLPDTTLAGNQKHITKEDDTILNHDAQLLSKQVNFDDSLKVHVFDSGVRRSIPQKRVKKSQKRRSLKSSRNFSLPIIPENIKTVKQEPQLKGRN